jgi:flagellar M-ring protein FliF
VLEPPSAQTLKTIKDLVAAATGVNTERGDQLIVESLPFEVSLNAEPPAPLATQPKAKQDGEQPAWLEQLNRNRQLVLMATLGIAVLLFLLRGLARLIFRRARKRTVEAPLPLPAGEDEPALHPGGPAGAVAAAERRAAPALESGMDVANRIRRMAQSESAVAANVVRLWLEESRSQ